MPNAKEVDLALQEAFQWLNSGEIRTAINSLVVSLGKIVKHLETSELAGMRADVASKVAMNLTKAVDELTRLMALIQGNPDQRTEVVGLADLLKVLSNEQFEQVSRWIDEGMERLEHPRGSA
jgi:hypothetical protein